MTATRHGAVTLREADPADLATLLDLVHRAYRAEGGWTTEAHLVAGARADADEIREAITDEVHLLLVAERDGAVVGCCYTALHEDGRGAELGLFAVDPDVQGGGIGRALLEEHARRRAAQGLEILDLRVLDSRPELAAWYARCGFADVGRPVPFAGNAADLKVPGLGMRVMVRPLP